MDELPTIDARRQELLEARFLGSSKGQTGSESNISIGSFGSDIESASGYTSTPEKPDKEKGEGRKGKKRKADSADKRGGANCKKINDYFGVTASSAVSPSRAKSDQNAQNYSTVLRSPSSHSYHSSNPSSSIDISGLVHLQKRNAISDENKCVQTDMTLAALSQIESQSSSVGMRNDRKLDDMIQKNSNLEHQIQEFKSLLEQYKEQLTKCKGVNKQLLIEKTKAEKKEARKKAMEGRLRLGQFARQGHGYHETWMNGWAFTDIERKREKINKEKEDIEKEKKLLNKRKPNNPRNKQASPVDSEGVFVKPKELRDHLTAQEFHERDEILRLRSVALRRDETDLQFELERLERERSLHIRELKRILNEDNSRFNDHPVLNDRYLLLNLLGKGGFSEVYRGFDSEQHRYVAIKIHHLNRDWHEQKKMDYARHANREAEIHRSVNHPRIVRLYDRFEVDINTFCTVMEYCEGNDLDFYLKQHKSMSEKEARTIVMQVVSALKYLNTLERPVIHYDLKPGNILMCDGAVCGNIKITDFGLSKQFDEGLSPREGMDLTSQGAGTYWYLPPECFVRGPGGQPPKIDNKVDVWSIGVIFYQCLYGRKPFGHNLTQEAILKQNTILQATEVTFPTKPAVSSEAKSFIRSCLMYHKEERADVFQLASHQYLIPPLSRRSAAAATNANVNGT